MSPPAVTYEDDKTGIRDAAYADRDQDAHSTRHRRRSHSRSPPRHRSDRSRSPVRRERSRSPRRSRSRSRSPRHMDTDKPSEPKWAGVPDGRRSDRDGSREFDPDKKAFSREVAATEAAKRSKKECRVYVGNLSFGVKWNDLKDFMREAGTVVFAEIMMLPNGMSKGCGVVEFSAPEEAQKAIRELSDQTLLGRPLFIREDREDDARYGAAAVSGRAGYVGPGAFSGPPRGGGFAGGRGGFQPGFQSGFGGGGFGGAAPGQGRHLFVQGLPFNVGWQDLKDLFRAAGSIIRADTKTNPDGTPSGTGTVVYETAQDAQNAIAMYNGFEFQGNILEVREDRSGPPGGGGGRGGFGGGFGRGGFQGGFPARGGFGGGFGGHQQFAPDPYAIPGAEFGGGFQGGFTGGRGGFGNQFAPRGFNASYAGSVPGVVVPPSTQIFVKNLPWSTSNEDLIELFQTTGKVEEAEVLFESGRSKGAGVVQFSTIEEAETAIAKFQSYSYGGRPLSLEFNGRFKVFGAPEGPGADVAPAMEQ